MQKQVLDALLAASDVVFVSPVYWFSVPSPLKLCLDQWSAWLRVPGLDFKSRMAMQAPVGGGDSGDRAKAQPMLDSCRLCAEFMGMEWKGRCGAKVGRRIRCSPTRRRWLRLKPTLQSI